MVNDDVVECPLCGGFTAGTQESPPVHVLQRAATVEEIVNLAAIAVVDAQGKLPEIFSTHPPVCWN